MSNSGIKRTGKKKGKILFLSVFLIMISLIVVMGFLFREKTTTEQKLKEEALRKEQLAEQLRFFETQAHIDSLLLQGETQKALELFEEQLQRADSTTEDFAELHLKIAKRFAETHRQSLQGRSAGIELEETEEKLTEMQDSLQLLAVEMESDRDSLARVVSSSMHQLRQVQQELAEKASRNFLTFNNSKGNKVFYIGEVQDGKAHGEGIGIWLTGSKYEGEWKNNKRHGEGVFEWADGERYEGEYKNDMRSGHGTYYWTNGEKYVGQWSQDRRSGQGAFYDKDGEVLAKGIWKEDELVQTTDEE